jgi:site-specific DNA-methyltransferase (adenine-specific)
MSWVVRHGDALELLQELPEGSIDALITDPPYSSGGMFRGDRATNDVRTKYVQTDSKSGKELPLFGGDSRDQRGWLMWCSLWLGAALRAAKPGAVGGLFCDWRQLPTASDALQCGGWVWRGVVAWHKPAARPVQGRFVNACEFFVWGTNGPRTLEGSPLPGFITCNSPRGEDREHITEKPLELMRHLVRIAPPDGLVVDPFAGSGTTGAACLAEGRRFIGMEINPAFVALARRRIAGPLFADIPPIASEGNR